jgi:TRAP-type C4-dicarboxylate transport system permease small subunit
MWLGTFLFILLAILVLAALLGAGGYSVRRYWSPAGSEVVETSDTTSGVGVGVAGAAVALFVLMLLFFGLSQWNWFGSSSTAPQRNPTVSTPATNNNGGATTAPSPVPSSTP